jgi:hypothetical protein
MYEVSWQMVSPWEVEEVEDLRGKIEAERSIDRVVPPVNASRTLQGASLYKMSKFPKKHKLICSKFDHLLLCLTGKPDALCFPYPG